MGADLASISPLSTAIANASSPSPSPSRSLLATVDKMVTQMISMQSMKSSFRSVGIMLLNDTQWISGQNRQLEVRAGHAVVFTCSHTCSWGEKRRKETNGTHRDQACSRAFSRYLQEEQKNEKQGTGCCGLSPAFR